MKQPIFSTQNYQDRLLFATIAHKNQKTPQGYPYLIHLILVTSEVIEASFYDDFSFDEINIAISCALLHDTIEDTTTTYEEIKERFGEVIANGVLALSKNEKLKKEEQMIDSLNRLKLQPKYIQMVKLADRITNLQKPPSYWSREKITNYYNEAKMILSKLKDSSKFLSKKLETKIKEYRVYLS